MASIVFTTASGTTTVTAADGSGDQAVSIPRTSTLVGTDIANTFTANQTFTGTLASGALTVTGNETVTGDISIGTAADVDKVIGRVGSYAGGVRSLTLRAGSTSDNVSGTGGAFIKLGNALNAGGNYGIINYSANDGGAGSAAHKFDIKGTEALIIDINADVTIPNGNLSVTGQYIEEYAATGTSGAVTIDLDTGNNFSTAMAGAVTYTFSNAATSGTVSSFTLKVVNNGSAITWPASVDWPAGTAPTLSASGATDVFVFYTHDGGTTWYGFTAGQAMA